MYEQNDEPMSFGYTTPVVDADLEYLSESDFETLSCLLKDADINAED